MEKHSCKLCFKSFASGRALGGHMRSHMATLSTPPKTHQVHHHQHLLGDKSDSASSASSSSSSSSGEEEDEEEKGLYYGLRENPKKSFRLVDPEFSFVVDAGSVVQDRESETESSKNPSRRRSKRDRKSSIIGEQRNLQQQQQQPHTPELKKPKSSKPSKAESPPEPEPVSSVSDTSPEEDVARCLMMLSKDIWMREEEEVVEEEEDDEEEEKSTDESDDSEELKFPTRTRGRYQCGTCKKVFRSYQALGGHRASHKKIRGCIPSSSYAVRTLEAESEPGNAGTSTVDRRIHECPVCFRIFGSGQALGGHKRSHLSGSATATNTVKFGDNLIDLNLPAPVDDDDMSQVELSAVSDAEFLDPTK